jgi:hypothetical protein
MDQAKTQQMGTFLNKAAEIIKKTEKIPSKGTNYNNVNDVDYGAQFEEQILSSYTPIEAPKNNGQIGAAAKKLPSSILESLVSNPIQNSNEIGGFSVLDNLIPRQAPASQQMRAPINEGYGGEKEMPTTEELLQRSRALRGGNVQVKPKQQIQEDYHPKKQTIPSGSGIDYEILKMIIEGCIDKKLSAMKKEILCESNSNVVNEDVILTVGTSIRFIAKNGNVYEGKVKKVGNLNSK